MATSAQSIMSEFVAPFEENTEAGDLSLTPPCGDKITKNRRVGEISLSKLLSDDRRLGLLFELVFRYRAIAAHQLGLVKPAPNRVMPIAAVDCVN